MTQENIDAAWRTYDAKRPLGDVGCERAFKAGWNAALPGWQPIKTAPLDQWILVWDGDDNIDQDKWSRCAVVRWRTVGRTRMHGPSWYDDRLFPVPGAKFWTLLPSPPNGEDGT